MKLIKPSFEILEQAPGLEGMKKQIELAGRTCYKSNDKITEGSAEKFVDNMVKSGHGAMLEHGTVYLYFEYASPITDINYIYLTDMRLAFERNKYSKVKVLSPDNYMHHVYVTTNYRVIVENHLEEALQFICEPTEYHERRITVKFICDRGVTHEFVRHRVFSFAQESTRYCNYSKDKFGNEITCIIPPWLNMSEGNYGTKSEPLIVSREEHDGVAREFIKGCQEAEYYYFKLLDLQWKPQQARAVLPNSLKAELVMTGFVSDWAHFFALRDDSHAHPQAIELARPLHEEFIKRSYIK